MKIMANVSLIFYGQDQDTTLECYASSKNEIVIQLFGDNDNPLTVNFIELDKSTAIKFAKTLRTEINKISE